jgi:hypothetical protein
MSVLTGLLQAAGRTFCQITVKDNDVALTIKEIVFANLEISEEDQEMGDVW